MHTIVVKNMVCPRCIETVRKILLSLGVDMHSVELGEITLSAPLSPSSKTHLAEALASHGFEILEDEASRLISKIKTLLIERIHGETGPKQLKVSVYLSKALAIEYSRLSKLFSSVEGLTIERYTTLQRIEKAKELLAYREGSITDISERLDYSSPAYFSNQFKLETGMTPSQFQKLRPIQRRGIDSI